MQSGRNLDCAFAAFSARSIRLSMVGAGIVWELPIRFRRLCAGLKSKGGLDSHQTFLHRTHRLVHNAHRIELRGESMRKNRTKKSDADSPSTA